VVPRNVAKANCTFCPYKAVTSFVPWPSKRTRTVSSKSTDQWFFL